MFKKFLFLIFSIIFFQTAVFASELSDSIDDILNSFDFDSDSVVSISVKDKDNVVVYNKNRHKFLNPASTLKLFTMAASMGTLGEDYNFATVFYKDNKNNYYLKLSADPMLTSTDLEVLAEKLRINSGGKPLKIYIDDSIIDLVPYPDGWAFDDFWPNSSKVSPYMVDKNIIKIEIYYNKDTNETRIMQKGLYRFSFINKLQPGSSDNIKFVYDEVHNTVDVTGTIASPYVIKNIPVLNPRYYFCTKLNQALNKRGIRYSDKFLFAKTPSGAKPVVSFKRPIGEVVYNILSTSDNVGAEIVFKVAGAKYAEKTSPIKTAPYTFGTNQNGINMFYDYYNKLGLDTEKIKIRDGSGVSRYNAVTVDWISSALSMLNFDYEKYLPTAGEGTLAKRMRELKGKVYFKTGTLYGLSSLAGVIETKKGNYYYSSIIMGYNRNSSLIKGVEDEIIYEIFRAGNNE